jgi:hypothetical protein
VLVLVLGAPRPGPVQDGQQELDETEPGAVLNRGPGAVLSPAPEVVLNRGPGAVPRPGPAGLPAMAGVPGTWTERTFLTTGQSSTGESSPVASTTEGDWRDQSGVGRTRSAGTPQASAGRTGRAG